MKMRMMKTTMENESAMSSQVTAIFGAEHTR